MRIEAEMTSVTYTYSASYLVPMHYIMSQAHIYSISYVQDKHSHQSGPVIGDVHAHIDVGVSKEWSIAFPVGTSSKMSRLPLLTSSLNYRTISHFSFVAVGIKACHEGPPVNH